MSSYFILQKDFLKDEHKEIIKLSKLHSYKDIHPLPKHIDAFTKPTSQPRYESNEFQAGMNILVYGHPDMSEVRPLFNHLRGLGLNSIAISFPIFQENWKANQVSKHPEITPTLSELKVLIECAHDFGISVMLRPILDEKSLVKTNKWRGEIEPTNYEAWFDSYTRLLTIYAELAQLSDVNVLNIGTELNSLEQKYNDQWIQLIQDIREVYEGKLIYSLNWDSFHNREGKKFLEHLDYVGIDAYFPLDKPDGASVDDLVEAWDKWIDKLKGLLNDEAVIITEAGIVPARGAYRKPYSWFFHHQPIDWQAQSNYYEATFLSWNPFVKGIYWWNVSLNQDPEELSYSPLHSPTELIIKKYLLEGLDHNETSY